MSLILLPGLVLVAMVGMISFCYHTGRSNILHFGYRSTARKEPARFSSHARLFNPVALLFEPNLSTSHMSLLIGQCYNLLRTLLPVNCERPLRPIQRRVAAPLKGQRNQLAAEINHRTCFGPVVAYALLRAFLATRRFPLIKRPERSAPL